MARSRVELFEQIRRDRRAGESSIRELAEKHRVHRRTVRQALASAVPPARKAYSQRPKLEGVDGGPVLHRVVPQAGLDLTVWVSWRWRGTVSNLLTLPYSSGAVEGHVNRIKMIKRQMYGRANPDLLRRVHD